MPRLANLAPIPTAAGPLILQPPDWLEPWLQRAAPAADDASRMREVLALAAANVDQGTGGPFAAVVYSLADGSRLAVAVNTAVANHCAAAHAELQALSLAQQRIQQFTLQAVPALLVSSGAPCAMCLGAIAWSGVQELIFSAPRAAVEAIGFDEGPVPAHWRQALVSRGVTVRGPILATAGRAILQRYREHGGLIYNADPAPPTASA